MKSYLDEQNVDYDDAWTTEYLSNLVRRRKRRAGGAAGCYHGMWSIFLISVKMPVALRCRLWLSQGSD